MAEKRSDWTGQEGEKRNMKIVILDGYCENPGDLSWEGFKEFGEVTVYDRIDGGEEEIIRAVGDAEIVLTNKTPITENVLETCPQVKFIGVLATGYNVVDIQAARERNIPVCNVPEYGTRAVGEYAMALLLEICHHVGHHAEAVREGRWESCPDFCFWDYPLMDLDGKTMGIIGFGRIGRTTGHLAKAFGMKVLATGSRPVPEGREIADYVDLDTLLKESDVIALHCPLTPDTKDVICKENIRKMKDGVILINNARGGCVVEQDLADALNSGKVAYAGLDVVSTEPVRGDNPLLKAKNCIITPHISWASKECRQRIMDTSVENLRSFLKGEPVNVVNK